MKDSGVEWIGEIPKEWKIRKVKLCYSIISGSGFADSLQGKESGELPVCKASDISNAGHNLNSAANYLSRAEASVNGFSIIPIGSVLFPKIGEAMRKNSRTISRVPCCLDNNCQAAVPQNIDTEYGYYVLFSVDMTWFDNNGTVPCINNSKFKNAFLPIPPPLEQHRIADYLDAKCAEIDKVVEKTRGTIEEYKKLKQSIITETVTKGLNPDAEMKDSGIPWIGKIPVEWMVIRFKFSHNGANVGESIDKDFWSNDDTDRLFYTAGLTPIHTCYTHFQNWKLTNRNDLLLARNGTPYVYLPENGAAYSDHIIRVEIVTEYDRRFVRYCLQQSILSEAVDSVSITTWSISIWNKQCLSMPNIQEQHRIADYLDAKCAELDSIIEKKEQLIEELGSYRKSLIYEYVTGKKEVQA